MEMVPVRREPLGDCGVEGWTGGCGGAGVWAGATAAATGWGAGFGWGSMSVLGPLAIYVCGSVVLFTLGDATVAFMTLGVATVAEHNFIRHISTKRFLLLASRKRNS